MRKIGLGVLLVGFMVCLVAAQDGSVLWPYPAERRGDLEPSQLSGPILCALLCFTGGCDFVPDIINCSCTGGTVKCLQVMCVLDPICHCATMIADTGITCTPGEPIPYSMER